MDKISLIAKHPVVYSVAMIILSTLFLFVSMVPLGYIMSLANISFDSTFAEQLFDGLGRLISAIFVLIVTHFLLDKKYNYQFSRNNLLKWSPAFIPAIVMLIGALGLAFTLKISGSTELILSPIIIGMAIFQAICVGIYEEITFRGLFCQSLLKSCKKRAVSNAVFITMIFFALIHFTGGPIQVLSVIGTGLFMVAIYIRSKNIWVPIIFHAIWNSAIFIISLPVVTDQPLLLYASNMVLETGNFDTPAMFSTLVNTCSFIFPLLLFIVGLFLVRKSKHVEIKELWGLSETVEVR